MSRGNTHLVRQIEGYSYDKFVWDVKEIGTPKVIELGGKQVEIFEKGHYEFIKKSPDKNLLKEIWATGSILDGNSSGRFFRDYLNGRSMTDGLGVLYKVYGIGDDERPYRYFTGPQREGATKGKYYQGVPNDVLSNPDEARKEKPIVTFFDLAADFGNCRHEGNVGFRSGKKPLALLNKLLSIISWGDADIILDFFAGSATTAHAVMQLNADDGHNRQFIMVQLPESCDEKSEAYKTIAEIGKERIRRAGKKILEGKCHENWNKDIGFRVLKVDSSNMSEVFYTPDTIKQGQLMAFTNNIKPERTPEDLLFQILLDWGVDLSLPIHKETLQGKTVFFVDDNALAACFDTGVNEELVKELARFVPLRMVFRDNGFVSDAVKINVGQIFKQMSPSTEVKSI
jgi:adenine-specific DNA-methyltransferase